jgi:hypothetical protein
VYADNTINWSDLHKDATTVLTGDFPVVVTSATAAQSSTGKPMIKATLKIESGTFAGRSLFNNFNVTADNPSAMRIFFGQMSVLGLGTAFWNSNPTLEQVADALVRRRAIVTVGSRQWQGTDREQIENWKPAVGGPGGDGQGALGGFSPAPAGNPNMRFDTVPTPGTTPTEPVVAEQPSTPPPVDPFA